MVSESLVSSGTDPSTFTSIAPEFKRSSESRLFPSMKLTDHFLPLEFTVSLRSDSSSGTYQVVAINHRPNHRVDSSLISIDNNITGCT